MLCNPRIGQRVKLRYAAKWRGFGANYDGYAGIVVIRSRGPGPRNHAVKLDNGKLFIVPCGNLQPVKEATE